MISFALRVYPSTLLYLRYDTFAINPKHFYNLGFLISGVYEKFKND